MDVKKASLQIVVNTTEAIQALEMYDKATDKAAQSTTKFVTKNTTIRDSNNRVTNSYNTVNNTIIKNSQLHQRAARSVETHSSSIKGLYRNLVLLSGGLFSVRSALNMGKEFAAFELAIVNVSKTANLNKIGTDLVEKGILDASTRVPVSIKELTTIAGVAGQLGINQPKDIVAFTEVTAQLTRTTNLTAEQAATDVARFLNVMGRGIEEAETVANVLVALGNNTAAFESEILGQARYLAQSTGRYGLSLDTNLGFAATAAEFDIRRELSASAIQRFVDKIDVARDGRTGQGQEYRNTLGVIGVTNFDNKSTQELTLEFLEKLRDFAAGGGSLTLLQDLLDLGGAENNRVIPTLALNFDRLARNIGIAEDALESNNAMQQEFQRYTEALTSRVELLKNTFQATYFQFNDALPLAGEVVDFGTETLASIGGIALENEKISTSAKAAAAGITIMATGLTVLTGLGVITWFKRLNTQLLITAGLMNTPAGFRSPRGGAVVLGSGASLLRAGLVGGSAYGGYQLGEKIKEENPLFVDTMGNKVLEYANDVYDILKTGGDLLVLAGESILFALSKLPGFGGWDGDRTFKSTISERQLVNLQSVLSEDQVKNLLGDRVSGGSYRFGSANRSIAIAALQNEDSNIESVQAYLAGRAYVARGEADPVTQELLFPGKLQEQREAIKKFEKDVADIYLEMLEGPASSIIVALRDFEGLKVSKLSPETVSTTYGQAFSDLEELSQKALSSFDFSKEGHAQSFIQFVEYLESQYEALERNSLTLVTLRDKRRQAESQILSESMFSRTAYDNTLRLQGYEPEDEGVTVGLSGIIAKVTQDAKKMGAEQTKRAREAMDELLKEYEVKEESTKATREAAAAEARLIQERQRAFAALNAEFDRLDNILGRKFGDPDNENRAKVQEQLRFLGVNPNPDTRFNIQSEVAAMELIGKTEQEIYDFVMKSYDDKSKAAEDYLEKQERLKKAADSIGSSFSDSTKSIIEDFGNLGSAIESLARTIQEALLEALVLSPLRAGVTNLAGSLLQNTGLFGQPTSPSGPSANVGLAGSVLASVATTNFATGGVFLGGASIGPMATIGEAGPEAILPLAHGADGKLGVKSTGGFGGTTVINNTINLPKEKGRGFGRSQRQLVRELEVLMKGNR